MHRPKFRLFHYPATRSARVKWVLHEALEDDFAVEIVDLYRGIQYGPEYLARNPNHNVPTLEVTFPDGSTLDMIESGAMVAWIADLFPEKGLAPPVDTLSPARADYLQMLHFGASWMDMMLWQIRVHEHLLPPEERDPRSSRRYRAKMANEVEPQLRRRLESSAFICGDTFTAADCVIGHNVTWARAYGMCRDEVFRNYLSRISRRPAFVKAFADAAEFNPAPPDKAVASGKFTG
jgi:glutathione S-transferase